MVEIAHIYYSPELDEIKILDGAYSRTIVFPVQTERQSGVTWMEVKDTPIYCIEQLCRTVYKEVKYEYIDSFLEETYES